MSPEIRFSPPWRTRRRIAGLVILSLLSKSMFRWRLAPTFSNLFLPFPRLAFHGVDVSLNKSVFTSTFYVHFVHAYPYLPGTTLASLYRPISDRDFGAIQPLSITLQILRVTLSVYQGPQVRFFGQKIDDSQWLNKVEKSLTNMQYVFSFIWFIGNLSHWFYYKSDKKMMKAS